MECDLPAFYSWSEPVARKEHKCCECTAPITKGEKHLVATGKWDRGLSSFRQHLLCAEACMFIRDKLNDGECICFGGLDDFYRGMQWQCGDKTDAVWREFRNKLAAIKRRERIAQRPLFPR